MLRGAWQEATLCGLLLAAVAGMIFARGADDPGLAALSIIRFDDPAASLWIIMLTIQSLPYAATVATAWISAQAYGRQNKSGALTPANEPVIPKAA